MKKYDLIVVGGGVSGIAASISAAREGLKVLLIEKTGNLGGAMSNSLVFPFMRHVTIGEEKKVLAAGIFGEMKKRFLEYGEHSWEFYKIIFDEMVTEAGVEVLFHSVAYSIESEDRNLKKLSVATKAGVLEFEADFFIDASGDGELFAMAGCDYQLGREADGYCQPMTTCFRLSNVDLKKFHEEKDQLQALYKQERENGNILNPRENILTFTGVGNGILHFNTTRVVMHNPVDSFEISRAEITARKQVYEMIKFLKKNSTAFENAELVNLGNHIGVRESRKLKGVHMLTGDEIMALTRFEDTIALGNYAIDIHNPTGTGTIMRHLKNSDYYNIPYRSLLPKEYNNLLVAGRCLSADHEAHSAVRVIPTCTCMGEAAGKAAVVAKQTGKDAHTLDVKLVQDLLRKCGAAID